ncbi:MAG: hypothetical protein OXC99_02460 [Chloroflexi bacterium]|nr:hypothetical protein [Chloroflexota bacterium]
MPPGLREVADSDLDSLGIPYCDATAPVVSAEDVDTGLIGDLIALVDMIISWFSGS